MDARKEIVDLLVGLTELDAGTLDAALETPPGDMGDFALPCFKLARTMRKAPPAIAADIAERAAGTLAILDRIEAVGGYVNFFLSHALYTADAIRRALDGGGLPETEPVGNNETVLMEFSSPNIAKPFHVGHAFTTILGHSLARIYEHLGYKVVRLNHIGDYGTQFGKLISAYRRWGDDSALEKDPIGELFRIYVKFHQEEADDPALEAEGRKYFRNLEEGSEEEVGMWKHFRDLSLREFERLYRRLGVTFDNYNGESFYSDKIPAVVDMLTEKGLLEESQGAMVVRLDDENLPPCIVLKSDGATIYASRDLAAVLYRKKTYDFHKNIYVVGIPQTMHFKQVFSVLEKAGFEYAKDCVHVGFGTIRFAGAAFSSRKGNAPLLEDLLDQVVGKAHEIVTGNAVDRGTEMSDGEMSGIAEKVGIGSILFSYLKNGRERDIVFSLDDMLDFDGDTAPYILYTYARIRSILRKAKEEKRSWADPSAERLARLSLPEEFGIARQLDAIPGAIEHAAADNEPFYVSRQVLALVRSFNKYYNSHSILNAGDSELVSARLAMIEVVSNAIRMGLYLLGIDVVDRM